MQKTTNAPKECDISTKPTFRNDLVHNFNLSSQPAISPETNNESRKTTSQPDGAN